MKLRVKKSLRKQDLKIENLDDSSEIYSLTTQEMSDLNLCSKEKPHLSKFCEIIQDPYSLFSNEESEKWDFKYMKGGDLHLLNNSQHFIQNLKEGN